MMHPKMSRTMELYFISVGVHCVLNNLTAKPKVETKSEIRVKSKRKKWTTEQHRKYAETMEKKWGNRRKNKTKE